MKEKTMEEEKNIDKKEITNESNVIEEKNNTASSADTARAVVPLRTGSKPSKPISFAAIRTIVFFTTW